jgi:hypothetical protein
MTDLLTLQAKLDRLTKLRDEKDQLKAVYDDANDEYEALRQEILADLVQNNIKSIKNDHLAVSRKEKTTIVITDQAKVKHWLQSHGFDVEEYIKLDETRVKAALQPRLKETGELPDGVTTESTEFISVSSLKEKE